MMALRGKSIVPEDINGNRSITSIFNRAICMLVILIDNLGRITMSFHLKYHFQSIPLLNANSF